MFALKISTALFLAVLVPAVSGLAQSAQARAADAPEATQSGDKAAALPQSFDTSKLLIPNSKEIVFATDGAASWAKQQRGTYGDWHYILFSDGTGIVRPLSNPRGAVIQINCSNAGSCTLRQGQERLHIQAGKPPALPTPPRKGSGVALARYLAQGVLSQETAPQEPRKPATTQIALPVQNIQPPVTARTQTRPPAARPAAPQPQSVTQAPHPTVTLSSSGKPRSPQQAAAHPRSERDLSQPKRGGLPPQERSFLACTNPDDIPSGFCAPRPSAPARAPAPSANTQPQDPEESWVKRFRLACSASTSVSLSHEDESGADQNIGKPRASIGCSAQLTPRLSARVALIGYFIRSHKSASDADFSYAFTYKLSDKIKLSYSNYSARFGSGDKGFAKSLTSGSLRASYRLPQIKLPFEKTARCSASIGLPDPTDSAVRLSCGVAVTKKLSLRGTAHAYLPGQQSGSDPDFSYSANYKLSDQFQLIYSNYGNNRFFWNPGNGSGKGLRGGSLTLSYKFKF